MSPPPSPQIGVFLFVFGLGDSCHDLPYGSTQRDEEEEDSRRDTPVEDRMTRVSMCLWPHFQSGLVEQQACSLPSS